MTQKESSRTHSSCICGWTLRVDREGFLFCDECGRQGWGIKAVVVTRHHALVEYLLEENLLPDGPIKWVEHAEKWEISGRVVYGNLPFHLAAEASEVVHIPLNIPQEKRGEELTVEEIREYAGQPVSYRIERVEDDE